MHESVSLNSDSKKGAKQMQNRHLTEILPYMQNLLVPASNWSKSLFYVQKFNFDKTLLFGHNWIFEPKLEDVLQYFILKSVK